MKNIFSRSAMVERLLQERLLVDHALVERPGVLGQAERRELAEELGQVDRVDRGQEIGSAGLPGSMLMGVT